MEELGWKPYQSDHEDGNGQFEMNWEYDDCLITADRHVFFKFMIKSVAEKYGMVATFMPKPFADKTGNGAHTHVSLWDLKGETNLFYNEAGELGLSAIAYNFLGGVLKHAEAFSAISNPTVNSYKRIGSAAVVTDSGSSWAPASISYTGNNRTHMIRIPDSGRFEIRLPDGAVNPYLLQAAILSVGLDGVTTKTNPGERSDWNGHLPNPSKNLRTLPGNLWDALQALDNSAFFKQVWGEGVVSSYLKLRREQWHSYLQHFSQWEVLHTLDV
eukprot:TRINITY_DN4664_c0_g3_i1.p1 TRINITY_DN4664_c0_g3~~TRINITY_DN4664_c0_g3_i1.p1  ORF type:complete len:292 (-),score=75.60 TRINITY_DN4664_c0_g3_i1:58-870(-)